MVNRDEASVLPRQRSFHRREQQVSLGAGELLGGIRARAVEEHSLRIVYRQMRALLLGAGYYGRSNHAANRTTARTAIPG